jgi:hypothetical protein
MNRPPDRFAFVVGGDFRASLESDYIEMRDSFEAGAWKGVHVLAGSVIEALLVDYLVATRTGTRRKDPLRLDLAEAIELCVAEGVLTARTKDLCSVVRSYRNLIHPGRAVRMNEAAPTRTTAQIVTSLVDVIIDEVAEKRRNTFGLTAEQIVSKVERDANSLAILSHLLDDVPGSEKERLLLQSIPERARLIAASDPAPFDPEWEVFDRLRGSYSELYRSVDDDVKKKVADKFVRILREDDGDFIQWYGDSFFTAAQLPFIADQQRAMVIKYLFARLGEGGGATRVEQIRGIETYVDPDDVKSWLDPLIRMYAKSDTADWLRTTIREYLIAAVNRLPTADAEDRMERRLGTWHKHFVDAEQHEQADRMAALQEDVSAARLPF